MITYLLLRNNKESGPYSLEQLLEYGLKAYDLVWVQGKSAAWRYASEVEALKAYAPAVEEQPFDRFYKKPAEQVSEIIPVIKQAEEKIPARQTVAEGHEKYLPKENTRQFTPKKSVFVTLPGQKTNPVRKTTPAVTPSRSAATEKKTVTPVVSTSINELYLEEGVVDTTIKYSQPLDDIKEQYVKTLQDRKERIARKTVLQSYLKKAAVIAGLIGVGVLAGFIIKPGGKTPAVIAHAVPPASPAVTSTDTAILPVTVRGEETPPQPVTDRAQTIDAATAEKLADPKPLTKEQLASIRLTKENMVAKPSVEKELEEQFAFAATEKDAVTGERNRTVRQDNGPIVPKNNEPKAVLKSSKTPGLENMVSISSNDYKKVPFGGIRNLQLTVTNKSTFELDQVIVELQYLKPSEEALKTETVQFKSIAANESSTVKIPDTNRGVKVAYRILTVESKQAAGGVANR